MDVPASQHAAWEDMLFDSKGRPRMTLSELIAEGMERDEVVAEVAQLEQQVERLREALEEIGRWSEAYPLKIFPEPDFAKAAQLLKDGGMTLDAISASNMRHVVEGVGKIAQQALAQQEE